jgi:hypothetical protein
MIISAGLIILFLAGCEVGKYPLILDASGKSRTIRVDVTPPASFSDSATIALADLKSLTDYNIDSIRFYNLTLHVSNNTSPENAAVTGEVIVNGTPLLALTNVQVTQFSEEKSIFDKTITGYSYNKLGVIFLLTAIKTQSPSELEVKLVVNQIENPLHFDLTITLYAQVFTNP